MGCSSSRNTDDDLYEDKEFKVKRELTNVKPEWKRPGEIESYPQFIVNGTSRMDVCQGKLGDCWFLAAAAVIADYPHLFTRVVPDGQSFGMGYTGKFYFNFFRCGQPGQWCPVTIDDRLPTLDGKLLLGSNSKQLNEFWPALLEKAFAKFKGGYNQLDGGLMDDGLACLTGGTGETIDLREQRVSFQYLLDKYSNKVLLGCATPNSQSTANVKNLVYGHVYSITCVVEIRQNRAHHQLIRLRNPWGNEEWNGRWSDKSKEWDTIAAATIEKLNVVLRDDGEFWMCYDDWKEHFELLYQCVLNKEDTAKIPDRA
jgi:hypothetical protein